MLGEKRIERVESLRVFLYDWERRVLEEFKILCHLVS